MNSVQIIHCGNEQDINALSYLKNLVRECEHPSNKLDFQHLTFREGQNYNISTLIHMEVEKYKKTNSFVVILLSKPMFEIMWRSTMKGTFLKMISMMKNSLHIWLDVNEDIVRRYSTVLLRRDLNFGRIHIDELNNNSGDADEKISTINKLLCTSKVRKNYQQNYAVDV